MARESPRREPIFAGADLPAGRASSFLEAIDEHASVAPDQTAMVFPVGGVSLTWSGLRQSSLVAAAAFREAGVGPGDLVGLLHRNDHRFVPALLGLWYLGAVGAPIPVPGAFADVEPYGEHIRGMLAVAGIRHVVHDSSLLSEHTEAAVRLTPEVGWIDAAAGSGEEASQPLRPRPLAADLALVSYTSGSTSTPKGVELTHANITAAISAFGIATGLSPEDRWGVWTPLFHDFALISTLTALSFRAAVWVWPPTRFIRHPGRWLAEFGRAAITHYSGPNFSFDLMHDSARDEDLSGLRLDSWRVAVSGGEPVSAATIERFTERFAPFGFRAETMVPGYGLAEATLAVTVPARGARPRVLTVSRAGLSDRHRVEPGTGDADSRSLVAVGRPAPGIKLRIVDGDRRPLQERAVGEIEVSGPSITRGYRGYPEAAPDGWLATGDLGFVDAGELFIAGRLKDIVNVRGTKYHPEDLEPMVAEVPGVHRGRCCVVGEGETDEHLAVIAETRLRDSELTALRSRILERVVRRLGVGEVRVHLVEPRTIQVTSNGKVRRQLMRRRLESGEIADLEGTLADAPQPRPREEARP